MRRIPMFALALGLLLPACGGGTSVPAFCGVSDAARVAISDATPQDYPSAAAGHVDAVRASANELTGEQGSRAKKVADDLEAASKQKANSVEFTDAYNTFVSDSNEFNHAYCNQQDVDL
jgi:hypothetical protein